MHFNNSKIYLFYTKLFLKCCIKYTKMLYFLRFLVFSIKYLLSIMLIFIVYKCSKYRNVPKMKFGMPFNKTEIYLFYTFCTIQNAEC